MGRPGMAEKREIRRPKVAAVVAFVDPIRGRPAEVGREISRTRSSGGGAPTWVARASRGWPETSPTATT